MRFSETELMQRHPHLEVCVVVYPFELVFLQNFGYYGHPGGIEFLRIGGVVFVVFFLI